MVISSCEMVTTTLSYHRCSLDGQDGDRRTYLDHADAVEATRTVRESTERAAAAAASTTSVTAAVLTGSGNAEPSMYRPEAHQVATDQCQSTVGKDEIQPPKNETKLEPKIDRLSLEGAENHRLDLTDDTFRGASTTLACSSDNKECHQSRSEITPPTAQPEVVTRRPVVELNWKSTCQEPRSERFDRFVLYFDSRHDISGKVSHWQNNLCIITSLFTRAWRFGKDHVRFHSIRLDVL